ncbi:amidohydrolase family protein [Sandaracinomonas limnophila]|uniref:Amidohydrolase family protein n=1 Tax=Sandaracinomonas limnophila TaxID=1862386 RepID=A0A437PS45_9BACT|nr:amidohydrolase family protein [Sandaracinomonas limnophila]RVU25039.1 amidohydrolase family protein [Sandaracinomonas limnophila]
MKKSLLLLSFCLIGLFTFAQKTIIHCGKLIDTKNLKVLEKMTIVVEGKKIVGLENGYRKGNSSDQIIDLKSKTVMPGLIDMHVHLESESNPNAYLDRFTKNPGDVAYQALVFAKRNLMAGFTTVRDLGGSHVVISLRNAINRGLIDGPRVFTAGVALGSTGGHADDSNGLNETFKKDLGPEDGVVNGTRDAAKAVRQRYKEGSDLIKITSTGGVLSYAKDGMGAQFTEEEIKAIVSTAKDYGFKVAAHAHGVEGMQRAIRGGVSSIEHGTFMDEQTMDLMKKYGTYYVPTVIAGRSTADSAQKPGYYPEMVRKKALEIGPKIQSTFGKAYKAGVKIAFGTDAGVFGHGKNALEFQLMQEAGMPALETIQAATVNAAELLGQSEVLGTIETGKFADIIAVDENPQDNIKTMTQVKFVMKEGKVYKN